MDHFQSGNPLRHDRSWEIAQTKDSVSLESAQTKESCSWESAQTKESSSWTDSNSWENAQSNNSSWNDSRDQFISLRKSSAESDKMLSNHSFKSPPKHPNSSSGNSFRQTRRYLASNFDDDSSSHFDSPKSFGRFSNSLSFKKSKFHNHNDRLHPREKSSNHHDNDYDNQKVNHSNPSFDNSLPEKLTSNLGEKFKWSWEGTQLWETLEPAGWDHLQPLKIQMNLLSGEIEKIIRIEMHKMQQINTRKITVLIQMAKNLNFYADYADLLERKVSRSIFGNFNKDVFLLFLLNDQCMRHYKRFGKFQGINYRFHFCLFIQSQFSYQFQGVFTICTKDVSTTQKKKDHFHSFKRCEMRLECPLNEYFETNERVGNFDFARTKSLGLMHVM